MTVSAMGKFWRGVKMPVEHSMHIPTADRTEIRRLAARYAEIGNDPVQTATAQRWRDLNALRPGRPLVSILQEPWHEFAEAVAPRSSDPWLQGIERRLRQAIWRWEHYPGDMVVEPVWYVSRAFHDSGYGLADNAKHSGQAQGAATYHGLFTRLEDVGQLRDPVITPNPEATAAEMARCQELFGDLLPVIERGVVHEWCAPWDRLVTWYGIDRLMEDVCERPELVHAAIGRFTDALLVRLDQLEAHGLLDVGNNWHGVGSGGYGVTDQLPTPADRPGRVTPQHQWGTSTGQIFTGMSPRMHEEFCLQYERRYLERFGLNCYGCCEPLDRKIALLETIPRLRRVSVSPWADRARMAAGLGARYVYSLKPNPTLVCAERFDEDLLRQDLRTSLAAARDCRVEIVFKDLHTLCGQPWRLERVHAIAMEEAGAPSCAATTSTAA